MTLEELDEALGPALADLTSGKLKRQVQAQEFLLEQAEEPPLQEAIARSLEPLIAHADSQVRGTVYLALAAARGERALPLLAPRASDGVSGARCALAQAAGRVGEAARPLLRALAADEVFAVRLEAALSLAALGDAAGLDALLQGLTDSGLRLEVLVALQQLADPRALEPVRRFFKRIFLSGWERTAAAGVLASLGEADGQKFLVAKIARGKGDELGIAIEAAGELKLEAAREGLRKLAGNFAHPYCGAALRALGTLHDDAAAEHASRLLVDESADSSLRMDAAEGLANLATPKARELLEEASRGIRDEDVANVVREALAGMADGRR